MKSHSKKDQTIQKKDSNPDSPQQTLQRKVIYGGNFSVDRQDEIDDWDVDAHYEFDDAQKALALYNEGDKNVNDINEELHAAFGDFESEPNLTLVISTDPNIEELGHTTFSVWDGSKMRSISQTGDDPATVDEWPAWMTSGNAIRMEVKINPKQGLTAIAHTLNHEISLHATSDLAMIRKIRDMNHPTMAKNYVNATMFQMGVYSSDYAHAQLGADKHSRLKATHLAMLAETDKVDDGTSEKLDREYYSDVDDHKKYVPKPYIPPHRRN
jgi:hypothetical protein